MHDAGFFTGVVTIHRDPFPYRLLVMTAEMESQLVDDPYSFGQWLGELDLHLHAEGTFLRSFEGDGSHPVTLNGAAGTNFAVWAPNARRKSALSAISTAGTAGAIPCGCTLMPASGRYLCPAWLPARATNTRSKPATAAFSSRPILMPSRLSALHERRRWFAGRRFHAHGRAKPLRARTAMRLYRFTRFTWARGGVCRMRQTVRSATANWPTRLFLMSRRWASRISS